MKRRTALTGVTGVIGAGLAGCLTDIGGNSVPETDDSTESEPCENGRKLIEAIANEEYERAEEYAPTEYSTIDTQGYLTELYSDSQFPPIDRIKCTGTTNVSVEEYGRNLDADVTDALTIRYDLTTTIDAESVEFDVEGEAVEIDDEWHLWISDGLMIEVQPDVGIEGNGTDAVTVSFTERGGVKRIFVQGASIESRTDYQLRREGASLTVSSDDVGTGQFDVLAEGWDGQTQVATQFTLGRRADWADVDEIVFAGRTTSWTGRKPAHIEGVENPTLVLERGRTYRIGWDQGDGTPHSLELRNADGEVVDDYATDITPDPGDGQFLTVTATDELATYRCTPHPAMEGAIEVVDDL